MTWNYGAKKPGKAKRKTKIMRKFRIDEISAVDKPAQAGATMLIMKRDVSEFNGNNTSFALVEKTLSLLSNVDGHSHLLDGAPLEGGDTSWGKATTDEYGHCHPWVRDTGGKITIGEANGHTHTITGLTKAFVEVSQEEFETISKAAGDPGDAQPEEEQTTMTKEEQDALNKALAEKAKAEGDLATAKAFGALTDVEKAHYNGLDAKDQPGFLAKSATERLSVIAKGAEANAVIYTSESGTEFRKNDDPRLVDMAKRNDAMAKENREIRERESNASFAKRAGTELSNLPGDEGTKVALLKSIETITDAAVRAKVGEILKAGNDAMSAAFVKAGTSAPGLTGAPVDQLEALAKRHAETHKVDLVKARVDVLNTTEGKALYEQTLAKA